jgi:hypothetical protein
MLRFCPAYFRLNKILFRIPEAAGDESSQDSEAGVRSQRHGIFSSGQVYCILHVPSLVDLYTSPD